MQGKLGLGRNCLNFDLGSACLGFLQGAIMASALIERGDIEHALIVDGEDCREIIESTIDRMLDESTDELVIKHYDQCGKFPLECPNKCEIGSVEQRWWSI